MANEDLSTANAALKEYYGYDEMEMLLLEGDPLYAMIEKRQGGGDGIPVPIQYADNAAFSGVLSTAQSDAPTGGKTQFLLVPNSFPNYYSVGKIARKAILGASKDSFSFLQLGTNKVDSAFRVMARNTQIHLYGSGSSDLGRIATAGISGAVITLATPTDAVKFQPGQVLQLSDTQTGGSVRAGTITLSKVDRKAGTLTATGNITAGIAAAAAADYIYVNGTYDVSVKGLNGWLPTTVSGSDSWFSVNRSADRVMLAGNPFNGTGMMCFEALLDAATEVNNNGGGQVITHAFMHNDRLNRLIKEAEAKTRNLRRIESRPTRADGSLASFGYKGVEITTPNGTFEAYGSRFCGLTDAFLLNMPSWVLWHIGESLADIEGRDSDRGMLVDGANDAYEARVISYPELACDAPGLNGKIYNFGA